MMPWFVYTLKAATTNSLLFPLISPERAYFLKTPNKPATIRWTLAATEGTGERRIGRRQWSVCVRTLVCREERESVRRGRKGSIICSWAVDEMSNLPLLKAVLKTWQQKHTSCFKVKLYPSNRDTIRQDCSVLNSEVFSFLGF